MYIYVLRYFWFTSSDCDANQAKQQAARERLCRRILTTCWSSFISFLNSTLKIETDFSGISLNSGSSASKMFKRKPTKFTAGELQLNEIGIRSDDELLFIKIQDIQTMQSIHIVDF